MVFLSATVHKVFYQVLVVKLFLEGSCRDFKWQGRSFFSYHTVTGNSLLIPQKFIIESIERPQWLSFGSYQ